MRSDADSLSGALTTPDKLMGSRAVWVGGAAPAFAKDLSGRRQSLPGIVQRFMDDIQQEIDAMPAMVTRAETNGRWKAPLPTW
jgi:hypothetical protein